jgi:hypothetical protein
MLPMVAIKVAEFIKNIIKQGTALVYFHKWLRVPHSWLVNKKMGANKKVVLYIT